MTAPSDDQVLVLRPSFALRALLIGAGVGGAVLFGALAIRNSPGWLVFAACAVPLLIDAVRRQVVVDHRTGVVQVSGAFGRKVVPIEDIENVRVPPWGPVLLTLKGADARGAARQISTGFPGQRRGDGGIAHQLATSLHVPVVSVWPAVRSNGKGSE